MEEAEKLIQKTKREPGTVEEWDNQTDMKGLSTIVRKMRRHKSQFIKYHICTTEYLFAPDDTGRTSSNLPGTLRIPSSHDVLLLGPEEVSFWQTQSQGHQSPEDGRLRVFMGKPSFKTVSFT
jgi:hypothetical protein